MSNADNPKNGADFQKKVQEWFQNKYGNTFRLEERIKIGNPPTEHKFDIVSPEKMIAIECKRHTWTETGNVPSAKLAFLNEAAFFLSFLPAAYEKYIVMLYSYHEQRQETLAEYYYRRYRHLLGDIIVAEFNEETKDLKIISEPANEEKPIPKYVEVDENRYEYIFVLRDYLQARGMVYDTALVSEIEERKRGKRYTLEDHIRAMIYSMLSNQTKWSRIVSHLQEIDDIFFHYNPEALMEASPIELTRQVRAIKCGNRNIGAQMNVLRVNIRTLQTIHNDFGSIDNFIDSMPIKDVVDLLSKRPSKYKLERLAEALIWEYLRNVGIDGAKPDTHLRRFFGADRMGTGERTPASAREVYTQIDELAEKTGLYKVEIDNLIWSFCADGYGEICTAKPSCKECPIARYCNYR